MEFKLGTRWNSLVSLLWTQWCRVPTGCPVPAASQGGWGVRSAEERLHGKGPFSGTQGAGRSRRRGHAQGGRVV